MQRILVMRSALVMAGAVMLALVASCKPSPQPQVRARAAFTPPPANCEATFGSTPIPFVTKGYQQYDCVNWVAGLEGDEPIQITQGVKQIGCTDPRGADKAFVQTALYADAGKLTDAPGGDYKEKQAFVVGTIRNDSPCELKGTNLKLAATTTYYIVVFDKGDKVELIPASGPSRQLKFTSCTDAGKPPGGSTGAAGDMAFLKNAGNICDHVHTPKFTLASMASDSAAAAATGVPKVALDDDAVVWLACAVDCCYAM